jgi:hypothetical protein
MDRLADRLEQAADALTMVDKRMSGHGVPANAFGAAASGGGLPGRLGRELHEHWAAVVEARSREAAGAAARLADMAQSVRATVRHYDETDDLVRRRLTRETS